MLNGAWTAAEIALCGCKPLPRPRASYRSRCNLAILTTCSGRLDKACSADIAIPALLTGLKKDGIANPEGRRTQRNVWSGITLFKGNRSVWGRATRKSRKNRIKTKLN